MPPLSDEQRDRLHYVHDMTRQLAQMLQRDEHRPAAALLALAATEIQNVMSETAAHRACGS